MPSLLFYAEEDRLGSWPVGHRSRDVSPVMCTTSTPREPLITHAPLGKRCGYSEKFMDM